MIDVTTTFAVISWKKEAYRKACIISNNKPLFAGDVGSGESNIRKWILDNDWLEAIIKLPGQMFYNTGINIYLNVFNKGKVENRRDKILLIDASDNDGEMNFHRPAKRSAGDKRNELTRQHVERIVKLYCDFETTQYLKNVYILIPPDDEQEKISLFLDANVPILNKAINVLSDEIKLLEK